MTIEMRIRGQIYRAATLLGADMELLAVLGSWGDTLPDEDVLDFLEQWNDATKGEASR